MIVAYIPSAMSTWMIFIVCFDHVHPVLVPQLTPSWGHTFKHMPRMTTLLTLLRLSKYAEYTYLQLHTTVLILCEHALVPHSSKMFIYLFILSILFLYSIFLFYLLLLFFLQGGGGGGGGEREGAYFSIK